MSVTASLYSVLRLPPRARSSSALDADLGDEASQHVSDKVNVVITDARVRYETNAPGRQSAALDAQV